MTPPFERREVTAAAPCEAKSHRQRMKQVGSLGIPSFGENNAEVMARRDAGKEARIAARRARREAKADV